MGKKSQSKTLPGKLEKMQQVLLENHFAATCQTKAVHAIKQKWRPTTRTKIIIFYFLFFVIPSGNIFQLPSIEATVLSKLDATKPKSGRYFLDEDSQLLPLFKFISPFGKYSKESNSSRPPRLQRFRLQKYNSTFKMFQDNWSLLIPYLGLIYFQKAEEKKL